MVPVLPRTADSAARAVGTSNCPTCALDPDNNADPIAHRRRWTPTTRPPGPRAAQGAVSPYDAVRDPQRGKEDR